MEEKNRYESAAVTTGPNGLRMVKPHERTINVDDPWRDYLHDWLAEFIGPLHGPARPWPYGWPPDEEATEAARRNIAAMRQRAYVAVFDRWIWSM